MSTLKRLILASASPRRVKLLSDAGFVFSQLAPLEPDSPAPANAWADASMTTIELARKKALSVAATLGGARPHTVLACDTLLRQHGRLIGKPGDESEARYVLKRLMLAPHQAVTGVTLHATQTNKTQTFFDIASVTITPLSRPALEAYLTSGQWHGKSGGYNFAELRDQWKFAIEGDPTTVVGLPMGKLRHVLETFDPACLPRE